MANRSGKADLAYILPFLSRIVILSLCLASIDTMAQTTTTEARRDALTKHPDSFDPGENIPIDTTPSPRDITADLIFGVCSTAVIMFLLVTILVLLVMACSSKRKKQFIYDMKVEKGGELELKGTKPIANGEGQVSATGSNSEGSYHNYEETVFGEAPPRGIPVADYPNYVHLNRQSAELVAEFQSLPDTDEAMQSYAREEENKPKNRYKNILPYSHSRVVLEKLPGDPYSDYINASYIDSFEREKAFIATQGPKKGTIEDFWRMVWQEKIRMIAMVTCLEEGLKKKCERYWPDEDTPDDSTEAYGQILVELKSSTDREFGIVRTFSLRKSSEAGEYRELVHYQFTKWPDKSVPKRTSLFLRYLKEVQRVYGQDNTAPLLVHCSAGIGRTGVVIALDCVAAQARKTGLVDVRGFVQSMRHSRQNMVQTDEQYVFLHEALLEMLICEDTRIPVDEFETRFEYLRERDPDSSQTRLEAEFAILDRLCPDPAPRAVRTGKMAECESKNRDPSILPIERNRVMLQTRVHGDAGGDYINASHVTADDNHKFMVTQMPLPVTMTDFWTLIYDYKPDIVVMLNELDTSDPLCLSYWPEEGSMECGPFTITTTSTEKQTGFVMRILHAQLTGTQNVREVRQYQFLGWPGDNVLLNDQSRRLLTELVQAVYPSESVLSAPKVLIHCMDGAGRSGVFCTLKMCLDQIAEEDAVDIFQIVKSLRVERMRMVTNEREYLLCYEVIDEYIKTPHTYENVTIATAVE